MSKWLVTVLIIFTSCSPRVIHFVNDDSAFKDYFTYHIVNFKVPTGGLSPKGQELINTLEAAFKFELERRAYTFEKKSPDVLLRYELIANTETRTNVNRSPFSALVEVDTRSIKQSALLLELTDRETKKLIWQSSVDLKQYNKKTKSLESLDGVITRLFNTYLYRAGQSKKDPTLISK